MNILKIIKLLKKNYPNAKYYLNFSNPLELVVAAILSARVRDEIVNETTSKLFKKYETVEDYAKADLDELIKDIKSISFAGNKAKYIKNSCKKIIEEYNGEVPDNVEDLTSLPGIGKKTANTILINAFNKVVGIPVDTWVIKVSFRLGWTKNKNPGKIEQDLMKIIPKKDWKKIAYLLKIHGRTICKAPVPHCSKCFLNEICPKKGVKRKK